MNKKRLSFSIATVALIAQGVFANGFGKEVEKFDVNSVEFIEQEEVIDLGFNTADYLPENFDANSFYYDINWITYIEAAETEEVNVPNHLPSNFDAYDNPKGIEGINYIDSNDEIILDFDSKANLPEGFNAFK